MKDGPFRIAAGVGNDGYVAGYVAARTDCCNNCDILPCGCPTPCSAPQLGLGVNPELTVATPGEELNLLWKLQVPVAPTPDAGAPDTGSSLDSGVTDGNPG